MEMRRKDKLMAAAEVEDVLKDTEYGILGTYGENGYPYAVPVNYVYKDNKIYLHGQKYQYQTVQKSFLYCCEKYRSDTGKFQYEVSECDLFW